MATAKYDTLNSAVLKRECRGDALGEHVARRRGISIGLIVLTLLLLTGGALRFVGISHGLPYVVGADEGFEIHRALKLGAGEIDLERVGKGGFFYVLFIEYGIYFVLLWTVGSVSSADEFAMSFMQDPTPFWLIARATHAFVAVLIIYWTYRLGRLYYGEREALVGAAVVAVSALHVNQAHYVSVDIPMTLLVLLTLEQAYPWSLGDRQGRPVLLGCLLGMAIMTKIVAVALLAPMAIAGWLRYCAPSSSQTSHGWRIAAVWALAALVLVLGEPGLLVSGGQAIGRMMSMFVGSPEQAEGFVEVGAGERRWGYYLEVLRGDLGWVMLAVSAVGMVWAAVKRRPADLLLLSTAVAFYVLIAAARTSHLYYPRYAIPLVPLLAVLGGRVLVCLADLLTTQRWQSSTVLAGTVIVLLAPTVNRSSACVVRQTRFDTRVRARHWVEANVPAGSAIFLIGNPVVDTAPNLSLPLRNMDSNVDRIIDQLPAEESIKVHALQQRKRVARGVPYDLRTVQHTKCNATLTEYEGQGVRYFALVGGGGGHFKLKGTGNDGKHATAVVQSRADLVTALESHPRARRVFEVDPDRDGLCGPRVEIYHLHAAERAEER